MNTIVPLPFSLFLLRVEMILAILQLRDAQRDHLGAFARELLDLLQFLPQLLSVFDLREDRFGENCPCFWENRFPLSAKLPIERATTFD